MKTSFWKSRPLALSAAGLVAAAGVCPAVAQTEDPQLDGRPGVDATPAELRAPAEQTDRAPSPLPSTTAGAARPLGGEEEKQQEEAGAAQAPGVPAAVGSTTVFSVISASVDFTTLAGAIQAAGMEDTLSEEGVAYTLFAPTNKAFEALPDGVLKVLLQPANQEVLRSLVSYHVVQGRLPSTELKPRNFATLTGDQITVAGAAEGRFTVQGANVTRVDVQAGNGVIHVIDQVLLPPGFSVEDFQPPEGAAVVVDEVTGELQKVEIPDDAVLPE